MQPDIIGAAAAIETALQTRVPCDPIAPLLAAGGIGAAYEVQQVLGQKRLQAGALAVGRKIGLTSPAVQTQIGVDQPDFGVLFDDMQYLDGAEISMTHLFQPRVEAEIAFVLAKDLPGPDFSTATVSAAIDYAVAAIEVVDSRVRDWKIGILDTVADNASSGVYVLGSRRLRLHEFAPQDVEMTMWCNQAAVSSGNGRECLGNPLNALAWLARTVADFGAPLKRGEVVLSGALGPVFSVEHGMKVVADLGPLGTVSANFSERESK
jgi:2-keto-4-pentenoate hydratase